MHGPLGDISMQSLGFQPTAPGSFLRTQLFANSLNFYKAFCLNIPKHFTDVMLFYSENTLPNGIIGSEGSYPKYFLYEICSHLCPVGNYVSSNYKLRVKLSAFWAMY